MLTPRWTIAAASAATLALGAVAPPAEAEVRVEHQVLPYYARIVTGTGDWSPMVFYRPAGCVPRMFNLFTFFDPPRAFGCGPQTVDGFAIWENGPGLDPAPQQALLKGLGDVPIWFVRTDDYRAASADGVVTIGDVEALSPLTGAARVFSQTQHPSPPAENGQLVINAKGTLDDGRSFRLHVTYHPDTGHRVVHVDFGD
jgi:hypothetical protein